MSNNIDLIYSIAGKKIWMNIRNVATNVISSRNSASKRLSIYKKNNKTHLIASISCFKTHMAAQDALQGNSTT